MTPLPLSVCIQSNRQVTNAITEPKELDELYQLMPENARNAAEDKDKKNLKNQAQNPSSPPTQK